MGAPQTLPADFNQWDSAPPTLPADFNQWDEPRAATPPAQPSAVSRLAGNFLSGLGVGSNEDAKNFFEHPIHTALDALNAQGELAEKARDAYNRGDYKSAIIHGLNYLVPFLGQQTDKAGQQLSQGDIAGGVGRTLGAALPIVAGSPEVQSAAGDAASATASAVKPIVAKTARVASDIVDPELTGVVSPRAAYAQKALGRLADALQKPNAKVAAASDAVLDATGENKPYAGSLAPKAQPELDATGENKPFAGGMDEPLPPKKPAQSTKSATPRTVVVDPKTGAPEFSDVVAANSPESTDLHMTAYDQAKAQLGPQASASDVLQEAARIQQAGPKAVRTVVMDEATGRPEFSDVVGARQQAAPQSTPRVAPDIANWQPPPELGVTSAPDYGAAARADVEKQMGGPLQRGNATATAEPETDLSPEAQAILGKLRENAKGIEAQNAEQASVPKPEDDLTDILERSIEAVKQKRLAAKKARTIQ